MQKQDNRLFVNHEIWLTNVDNHGVPPFSLTFEEKDNLLIAKLTEIESDPDHFGAALINDNGKIGQYIKNVNGTAHVIETTASRDEALKMKIKRESLHNDYVISIAGEDANEEKVIGVWQGGINAGRYHPDGGKWYFNWDGVHADEYTGKIKFKQGNASAWWKIEIPNEKHEREVILRSLSKDSLYKGKYIKELAWTEGESKWTDQKSEARIFIITKHQRDKKPGALPSYTLQYKERDQNKPREQFFTHRGGNNVMTDFDHGYSFWNIEKG